MRAAALLAALVAGLAVLIGAAETAAATAHHSTVEVNAAACHDPIVRDRYDGYHVGVPAGWYLSSIGGVIVVFPDYTLKTESLVQTAYVGASQSSRSFLSRMLSVFAGNAKRSGNVLTFHLTSSTTATVAGRVGTTTLAGAASVSFISVHSAHGARLGVVSAYWAPTSQLAGRRAELASVAACYGPEQGTLSRFFKDQAFGYTLPLGWKIGGENSDELFINEGQNASANFIFTGPFLGSTTGVTGAPSLLHYVFSKLGLNITTVLSSFTFPTSTSVTGAKQEEIVTEFLGTQRGKKLHGLVRVISSTGGGATSGAIRLAVATPALWNSVNGELIWISYGIEHGFTQDLQAILRTQQQLAGFAQQVAGFDHALNGTDLVRDPSTGFQYEAPYSAYSQSGPGGPGYYLGAPDNNHKLTVITP